MALTSAESLALFTGLPALIAGAAAVLGVVVNHFRDRRKEQGEDETRNEAQIRADLQAERIENTRLATRLIAESKRADEERELRFAAQSALLKASQDLIVVQGVRHEHRSIMRTAFQRLEAAGLDYRDLADRNRATETT